MPSRDGLPGLPAGPCRLPLLLWLALTAIVATYGSLAEGQLRTRVQRFAPGDFIVVINTDQERFKLALASRPLRQGLRTFIAVDNETLVDELNRAGNEHNETYAFFPNRNVSGPERDKPGDTRWQAAPFMAHRHYGLSYKWILLGDDDTLWFMLGVKRLLYGYNHTLPYAISDHMGDHNPRGFFVPSPLAAVCSPCHWPSLLAAAGRPQLTAQSPADVSEAEAYGWERSQLDAWGLEDPILMGRVRTRARFGGGSDAGEPGLGEGSGPGAGAGGGAGGGGASEGRGQGGTAAGAGGGRRRRQRRRRRPGGGAGAGAGSAAAGASRRRGLLAGPTSGFAEDLEWPPRKRPAASAPVNITALLQLAYYGPYLPDPDAHPDAKPPPVVTAPQPPPGCPCRPALGCLHRARVCRGTSGRGQELCGRALTFKLGFRGNRTRCRHSWAHGGAGVVLSVGLLQATVGSEVEECARRTQVHSCDMNLALCLQRAPGGGISFTHPGSAALKGASSWADPRFILFDNPVYPQVIHDPAAFLQGRITCGRKARAGAAAAAAAAAEMGRTEEDEQEEADEEEEEEERKAMEGADLDDGGGRQGGGEAEAERGGGVSGGVAGNSGEAITAAALAAGARRRLQSGSRSSVAATSPAQSSEALLSTADEGKQLSSGKGEQRRRRLRGVGDEEDEEEGRGEGGEDEEGEGGDSEDTDTCEWLVRHAVSVHMHGRSYPSYDAAAAAMSDVVRQHLRAAKILWERQAQGLQRGTGQGP